MTVRPPAADLPDWVERVGPELLPALQRAGLRLDLRAHLLVQAWLQEAGRAGTLPEQPADCRAVLLGLTAKSAREMALASAEFDAWCERLKSSEGAAVQPEPEPGPPDPEPVAPARWKRWLRGALKGLAWMVGVVALLFALLIAKDWWDKRGQTNAPAAPPTLVLDQVKSVAGTVEVDDGAAGRPGSAASASRTIAIPGPSAGRDFPVDETLLTRLQQGWGSLLQSIEPPTRLAGTHPGWWLLICTLLASLGYTLRRERQQVLARLETRERLREQQAWAGRRRPPSGAARGPWREAARLLRRPRADAGRVLDLPASVRASVAAAGLFRPVWRERRRMPAYLVLIERRRAGEPFATLAHELVRGLAEQGVALQVYEYDADPRWLRPWRRRAGVQGEGTASPGSASLLSSARLPLAALEASSGGQGLIVCSDGRSLLDARDGRLRPWVARALAAWPQRALLTPLDLDSWGAAEDRLAAEPTNPPPQQGAGFLLLPARRAALKTLAQVWAGLPAELADLPGAPRRLPALLRGAALRWLSRQAPPEDEVQGLKRELRRWLGPGAYRWLAASAAYPALSAELTGHLADVLEASAPASGAGADRSAAADSALREARLFALAQLPWYRQGRMPDWLRLALLADLTPDELARVRQALEALVEAGADERGELPLGAIATPDPAAAGLPARWTQWRRALHARWRREGPTTGEDADSPLRDVIYLGVLEGQVDQLLALRVGSGFAASLQRGDRLTANPLRWVAAGWLWLGWPMVVAAALWRGWGRNAARTGEGSHG
jgi:hypothetical protein